MAMGSHLLETIMALDRHSTQHAAAWQQGHRSGSSECTACLWEQCQFTAVGSRHMTAACSAPRACATAAAASAAAGGVRTTSNGWRHL